MKLKHYLTVFPNADVRLVNRSAKLIYLYINADAEQPEIDSRGSVDMCDRSLDLKSYEGE